MRLKFYADRVGPLLAAVTAGAAKHGDEVIPSLDTSVQYDGCIFYSIGGWQKKPMYDRYRAAGLTTVYLDKGYTRTARERNCYYRVAVNGFQPTGYLQRVNRPVDRFARLGLTLRPYGRHQDGPIIVDGASNKFCLWHGFDFKTWGAGIVERIRGIVPHCEVILRLRPSYKVALEPPLDEVLADARLVVSYGGNIGWDAVIAGVPHFAIGDSIARPVSETDWNAIDDPYIPTTADRQQWAYNVAYSQFTFHELSTGEAWGVIREQFTTKAPSP